MMSLSALAAPRLDKDVQNFLMSSQARGNQVLPVLLTYKTKPALPARPAHPRFHAEVEKAMIRNTLQQEQLIFKGSLRGSAQVTKTLWIANSSVASLRQDQLKSLVANSNLESISYSQKRVRLIAPQISHNLARAGTFTYGLQKLKVPELRAKYTNLNGNGIKVGILDTGIDPTHPDLAGKVKAFKDFTPAKNPVATDEHGHGTHVAGTISGGSASGQAIGVAPNVELVIGKIFDAQGSAKDEDILLSMQWMADPDGNPDTNDFPNLVSNSWGDDTPYSTKDPQDDPFCVVVENWTKLGMVPVFAAGNEGPSANTIGTPGACPYSLTVGATDSSDRAAYFSSRGPAKWKTVQYVKPNLAAPGVNTFSAKPGGGYQSMSGTSMATPHISGVMAILLQANPKLTVDQAEATILAGVTDLGTPGNDTTFGLGRADVLKSVDMMSGKFSN